MPKSFHPYISYFAQTDFRDQKDVFGILQHDRLVGMYLLGKQEVEKPMYLKH